MEELISLLFLGTIFGVGLSGFVWLIGYLITAAINVVFKNN